VSTPTLGSVLATALIGAGALADVARLKETRDRDAEGDRSAFGAAAQRDSLSIFGASGADRLRGQDGGDSTAALEIPVPTATAPGLMASSDTCMGSRSFGAQVMSIGFSVGRTWEDESCQRRKNARQLYALGYRRAAIALLCVDDEVRNAMRVAGTPCPGEELVSFDAPELQPQAEPAPPAPWPRHAVLFEFDSARLKPESDPLLQQMLATLQADPDASVEIVGHTDAVGTDAYNLGLSQRRAQAVVHWLVAHGIAPERLVAVGKGEAEPIADNGAALGRSQNRRVEIRRL
jgi:outer membrane protein OmpA-like peptidoglycan-associated protein